jgi:hypothetical protein
MSIADTVNTVVILYTYIFRKSCAECHKQQQRKKTTHLSALSFSNTNRVAVRTTGQIGSVFGQKSMMTIIAMKKFGIAQLPVEFAYTVHFPQPEDENNRQPDNHIKQYCRTLIKFYHNTPPAAS